MTPDPTPTDEEKALLGYVHYERTEEGWVATFHDPTTPPPTLTDEELAEMNNLPDGSLSKEEVACLIVALRASREEVKELQEWISRMDREANFD